MSQLIKYLLSGFQKGIVVGIPDFTQNNQYEDMKNIAADFQTAVKKVVYAKEQTANTRKSPNRDR